MPELLGDKVVIENILHKRHLLEIADNFHKEIKTCLIITGGGQAGAFSGGVVLGLEKLGLSDVFDFVIGVSAGAAAGMYLLSHQAELGTSIYYEDNVKNKFINFLRLRKIMDIDSLEVVFKKVKPPKN